MHSDPTLVLLHGAAGGSLAWSGVRRALPAGTPLVAPDMLGYGRAPAPSDGWSIDEEVAHLTAAIDTEAAGPLHLVAHSLGAMFGLHLRRALGSRVARLTLIDPVLVSVLRERDEVAGLAEMEGQYDTFMGRLAAPAEAAHGFVEHWSGRGAWEAMGARARAAIVAQVPRLRLEMIATRGDPTPLAVLAAAPPPTTILVGERTREAPRATARQLARALDATTVVVPGAAHMIPLTHAAAVAAALMPTRATTTTTTTTTASRGAHEVTP